MRIKSWRGVDVCWLFALSLCALAATHTANAQVTNGGGASAAQEPSVTNWLLRLNEASRNRAYTGTFVLSAGNVMSSARIWYVCDGVQQLERVDTLSGPPRTTVRHNHDVVTFDPEQRLTVMERRDSLGTFPSLLQTPSHTLADFYTLRRVPTLERVAGFDAEVAELLPRDVLRFGYRIWSEKKTGLVLKLQTLDAQQRVMEQVAFSELNLEAGLKVDQLLKQMKNRPGYTVQQLVSIRSKPELHGWRLKHPVPGFSSVTFNVRHEPNQPADAKAKSLVPAQWVFSDGLASVSLFVEPLDPSRLGGSEVQTSTGATHSLSRKMDGYWLTVVGEVPPTALRQFAQELERTH